MSETENWICDIIHQLATCTVEELEEVKVTWPENAEVSDKAKAFCVMAIDAVISAKTGEQVAAV